MYYHLGSYHDSIRALFEYRKENSTEYNEDYDALSFINPLK